MPKINLHTFNNLQDIKFFDICYNVANIVPHDEIHEVLRCDNLNYPILNKVKIMQNLTPIRQYLRQSTSNKLIVIDYLEGNNSIMSWLGQERIAEYVRSNQLIIISSGEFENGIFLNLDFFLGHIHSTYNQAIALNTFDKIFNQLNKPYKFLCLNKAKRPHRVELLELLKNLNLLDTALWSALYDNQTIPMEYNDYFNERKKETTINQTNHDNPWIDGLLVPDLYIDTYFSVVTETNFEIPRCYRTEKIYKPLLIGHPFIAVSGYHFYQGLHKLGFKTFGHLIDESFDDILNNNDRLVRIANTINNLCNSNLVEFLKEAKPICEYNRNLYFELLGTDPLRKYNSLINFFNELINAENT